MKRTKATLKNSKPKLGMGLHKHIAVGGDPKSYKGSKGINGQTVNGKK